MVLESMWGWFTGESMGVCGSGEAPKRLNTRVVKFGDFDDPNWTIQRTGESWADDLELEHTESGKRWLLSDGTVERVE